MRTMGAARGDRLTLKSSANVVILGEAVSESKPGSTKRCLMCCNVCVESKLACFEPRSHDYFLLIKLHPHRSNFQGGGGGGQGDLFLSPD